MASGVAPKGTWGTPLTIRESNAYWLDYAVFFIVRKSEFHLLSALPKTVPEHSGENFKSWRPRQGQPWTVSPTALPRQWCNPEHYPKQALEPLQQSTVESLCEARTSSPGSLRCLPLHLPWHGRKCGEFSRWLHTSKIHPSRTDLSSLISQIILKSLQTRTVFSGFCYLENFS